MELFVDLVLLPSERRGRFRRRNQTRLEQKVGRYAQPSALLTIQISAHRGTAEQARQEYLDRRGVPQSYAGLLLHGSYDGSVPRSCGWQTRQKHWLTQTPPHPLSPSKNPQILRWMAERIFKIFFCLWSAALKQIRLRKGCRSQRLLRIWVPLPNRKRRQGFRRSRIPPESPRYFAVG